MFLLLLLLLQIGLGYLCWSLSELMDLWLTKISSHPDFKNRVIPGSVQVGLKWKSIKNPKDRAITGFHVPTGSRDIAVQSFPPHKDATIFMILSLIPIKKKSRMTL